MYGSKIRSMERYHGIGEYGDNYLIYEVVRRMNNIGCGLSALRIVLRFIKEKTNPCFHGVGFVGWVGVFFLFVTSRRSRRLFRESG